MGQRASHLPLYTAVRQGGEAVSAKAVYLVPFKEDYVELFSENPFEAFDFAALFSDSVASVGQSENRCLRPFSRVVPHTATAPSPPSLT